MAEWFKASVLKTDVPQGTGGSNPSPSAILLAAARSVVEAHRQLGPLLTILRAGIADYRIHEGHGPGALCQ